MAYIVKDKFKGKPVTGMDNFSSEVRDVSDLTKSITCVASTDEPDRFRDIIDQSGWVLGPFKKNPIITKFHDYGSLPVGRAVDIWTELKRGVNRLMARIQFAPTPEGNTFYEMYKSKFLRGLSVGFLPIKSKKIDQPNKPEEDDVPMFHEPRKFIKQELLEIAAVGIPANSSCLAEVKSFVARGRLPGQCLSYSDGVLDLDDDDVIHLIDDENDDDEIMNIMESDLIRVNGISQEDLRPLIHSEVKQHVNNYLNGRILDYGSN